MSFQNFFQDLTPWFFSHGIRIIVILIISWLIARFGKVFISKLVITFIKKSNDLAKDVKIEEERTKTLLKVFSSTLKIVIWVIAILMILPEVGINPTPLLAGAGLIGLAIGMGAKNLVQDYLSGLFILIEDQYRIGDEIEIAGIKGKVREVTLRRTILEDSEGVIHYIPNGQVTKASNHSRKKK